MVAATVGLVVIWTRQDRTSQERRREKRRQKYMGKRA